MKSTRDTSGTVSLGIGSLLALMLVGCTFVYGQAPTQPAATRFVGSVTAISGTTLTVKTDAGEVHQVGVPASASLKRIAPGQKDLSTAATIQFSDLATGDRVLVRLDPNATGDTPEAVQIIAVKQEDVAQKQQSDREDWQKRGVGGLVKSVDAASGVIVLASGSGASAKTITVHTTTATMLKRYASDSVRFDAALPAPIDAIHGGDQLRARGKKNPDGTQLDAEEVISGTFRNISGVISSVDAASSTIVLKDLATKKMMTVHIPLDAQMRKLPETMARMLAARFKGSSSGSSGGNAQSQDATSSTSSGSARGGSEQWSGNAGGTAGAGSGAGRGQFSGAGGQGGADPQQMLSRLPPMQIGDLKKGDAVMLVSTDVATDVTAITLLAGVEPLLEAPAASQSLLNNWSLSSGAPDAAAQ